MFQGIYCGTRRVRIKPTKNQNEKNYGRRWGYRTLDLFRVKEALSH